LCHDLLRLSLRSGDLYFKFTPPLVLEHEGAERQLSGPNDLAKIPNFIFIFGGCKALGLKGILAAHDSGSKGFSYVELC
jgi:hypothetical protein